MEWGGWMRMLNAGDVAAAVTDPGVRAGRADKMAIAMEVCAYCGKYTDERCFSSGHFIFCVIERTGSAGHTVFARPRSGR